MNVNMSATRRLALVGVAAGVVAAGLVMPATASLGNAASGVPRIHVCGKYQADHRTWGLATTGGFSCRQAAQILRKLAGKPVPARLVYPGVFSGLTCTAGPSPGEQADRIFCGKRGGTVRGPGFMAAAKG